MKKMIKVIATILLLSVLSSSVVFAADETNVPFHSYTYLEDYSEVIMVPAPYTADTTIKGENLGIGAFKAISDVRYDQQKSFIYLTDAGNNRIVVLNEDYSLHKVITGFNRDGAEEGFNSPYSVFPKDNWIYISDTNNHRIVILDAEKYEFVKIIEQPEIKILGEYEFLPKSFAVDLAGRLYVIAQNINKGILQLDAEGKFERFVGAPKVTLTASEKFWRTFMTEAQRAQLEKAVPSEYNAIHIDKDGFLYLTTQDSEIPPITKLNCQGDNILTTGVFTPAGDTPYFELSLSKQTSHFVDVGVREDGIYAALDSSEGKIFVYDQEGTLLYCFGTNGSQRGTFRSASAIDIVGDSIFITDTSTGTLTVFKETTFGKAVDQAVTTMLDGKYTEAADYWNRVLELCPGYNYAYISLARTDIQEKNYDAAIEKLKGENSPEYYAKAFEGTRKQFISENFTLIFLGVFILIFVLMIGTKTWKKYEVTERLNQFPIVRELKFSNHTMFHPIDGFWDLKREKRGSFRAANILTVTYIICYGIRTQFSGYTFTGTLFEEIDVVVAILTMIMPFAMWIVSNWCFTTLMDGEGTMKDIYMATAYAFKPYIITALPMLILSHCLSGNEAFIYTTFDSIINIWMLGLVFFGMMITHNYSLGKGIVTAILSLLGICLMMFLALVSFNVLQDITSFGTDIYKEIIYRMY